MVIRDKQDLRKCVKQSVRRAGVIECTVNADVLYGEYGIQAQLSEWADPDGTLQQAFCSFCGGSPFAQKPAALLAALNALNLPLHDLDKAESLIAGYGKEAYFVHALDAMRARRVLIKTGMKGEPFRAMDDRFIPLMVIDPSVFEPGRYGVDYANAAQSMGEALDQANAEHILLEAFDEDAVRYCLIPLCEDAGTVLHIHVSSANELMKALELLKSHMDVHAVISTDAPYELLLIEQTAGVRNVRVQLGSSCNIRRALQVLGLRFIPFASRASSIEEMLGLWVRAKEEIWQALYEEYLLLARTGYELTRERIEADAERLLCGGLDFD